MTWLYVCLGIVLALGLGVLALRWGYEYLYNRPYP